MFMMKNYLKAILTILGILALLSFQSCVLAEDAAGQYGGGTDQRFALTSDDFAKSLGLNDGHVHKYKVLVIVKTDKGNFKYVEKNITSLNGTITIQTQDQLSKEVPQIKCQKLVGYLEIKAVSQNPLDLNLSLDVDSGMPTASMTNFTKTDLRYIHLWFKIYEDVKPRKVHRNTNPGFVYLSG